MNYQEAMNYIKSIQTGNPIKPGLETISNLLYALGNPQDRLHFIHIAGTNGKGSTAAFVASVLAAAGRKTGRYISPAVFSEFEKIQYVQGKETVMVTEQELADILTEIRTAIEKIEKEGKPVPTEFEIETAAAFLAFSRWNCDVVVLETGMGGRLDATNIVTHVDCSVLTPIAMDHMKFLGNTIERIAMEKAGIIKSGVPVVANQKNPSVRECIQKAAAAKGADLWFVDEKQIHIEEIFPGKTIFLYRGYGEFMIAQPGVYQVENACLALECIQQVAEKYGITKQAVKEGMRRAKWPGRFDILSEQPWVVADGAHNPQGVQSLLESLNVYFKDFRKIGIMGVFSDKEYATMCDMIEGVFEQMYTVTPPTKRGLSAEVLAAELNQGKMGMDAEKACPCVSVSEAFRMAVNLAEDGKCDKSIIVVFGSLSFLKLVYELV